MLEREGDGDNGIVVGLSVWGCVGMRGDAGRRVLTLFETDW